MAGSTSVTLLSDTFPDSAVSHVRESLGANLDLGSFVGGLGLPIWGGDAANDPLLSGRYGGYWPADRLQLPNHAPPGVLSEPQWRAILTWSRWLCEHNYLAIGFLETVSNFIGNVSVGWVKRGAAPGAVPDGGDDDDPLVKDAARFWEDWCEAAGWGHGEEDLQPEMRRRFLRDSEMILRVECGGPEDHYLPSVRTIDPEQIREPAEGTHALTTGDWSWGRCTDPDDVCRTRSWWVAYPRDGGLDGEEVPAEAIIFAKDNTDRVIKRGFPSFAPIESHLQVAIGLLANVGQTAKAQSAVAWIEKYATATPDQIVRQLAADPTNAARLMGGYGPVGLPTVGGYVGGGNRPLPVRHYPGGTTIHSDQGRQYDAGPVSTGLPSFLQTVDATMKAVGWRFGLPDWFTQGAQAYAAALVTGSPFARAIEARQQRFLGFTHRLACRVLACGERSGRLAPGTARAVKPVVTAKPVIIADEQKQAGVAEMELRNNLVDPQSLIRQKGRDPKVVLANIKAWKRETGGAESSTGTNDPLASSDGATSEPKAAPPGSAGGDGDDTDSLALEGVVLLDASIASLVREATGLVEKEVTVHRNGKAFTRKQLVRPGDSSSSRPDATRKSRTSVAKRAVQKLRSVGSAAWQSRAGRFLRAAEHKLSIVAHKTREVAQEAANRRRPPLDEAGKKRLARTLAIADFVGGYVTGGVAAAVVNPAAGKVAAFMPSVSLLYVAYSAVRDPAGTWAAARHVVKTTLSGTTHEAAPIDLAHALADLCGMPDAEWRVALFLAALAETQDPDQAVQMARISPDEPAMPPVPTVEDFGGELAQESGPPRPGLVPQTGDPEHPGHWVRPDSEGGQSQERLAGTGGNTSSPGATPHTKLDYRSHDPEHPVAKRIAGDTVVRQFLENFVQVHENDTLRKVKTTREFADKKHEEWLVACRAASGSRDEHSRERMALRKAEQEMEAANEAEKVARRNALPDTQRARRSLMTALQARDPIPAELTMHQGDARMKAKYNEWGGAFVKRAAIFDKFEPTEVEAASIKRAQEFVTTICEARGGEIAAEVHRSPDGRAAYRGKTSREPARLCVGKGQENARKETEGIKTLTQSVIHELGHAIETNKPGVAEAASAFLAYRVGSEEVQDISKVPGGSGMPREMGRKDHFDRHFDTISAYYVGKQYRDLDGNVRRDTEILSMGLEALYRDPVAFIRDDPEYAHFVIAMMRLR